MCVTSFFPAEEEIYPAAITNIYKSGVPLPRALSVGQGMNLHKKTYMPWKIWRSGMIDASEIPLDECGQYLYIGCYSNYQDLDTASSSADAAAMSCI